MSKSIRVLVVDDSLSAREMLIAILETDPEIKVIGIAKNGKEAIELTASLKPDLITMDVLMPIMDGLEAVKEIMAYTPTPIIVVTALLSKEVDVAFNALSLGVLDVCKKPTINDMTEGSTVRKELLKKIKVLSKVKVITHLAGRYKKIKTQPVISPPVIANPSRFRIIAIASSTGGPRCLLKIFTGLPEDFPLPIVVVQHITDGFTDGLVAWLDKECKISVVVGKEGELLKPGKVFIAPSQYHMIVGDKKTIRLNDAPPVNVHRPSANMLLSSVANVYGHSSIGVILTGMGEDGALGIKAIKEIGGITFAQEESSCAIFGMPKTAINMNVVDKVLSLEAISEELIKLSTSPI